MNNNNSFNLLIKQYKEYCLILYIMTIQFVYVKSEDLLWKNFLETIHKYKECLDNKTFTKNGGYYPRLTDTKKRGIKAYDDVVSYIDNNRGLKQQYRGYIDEVLCCSNPPEVSFDTLIFFQNDWDKILNKDKKLSFLKKLYEDDKLIISHLPNEFSTESPPMELPSSIKIEAIMATIDSFYLSNKDLNDIIKTLLDKLL